MNLGLTLTWDAMSRNGQQKDYVVAWMCGRVQPPLP